jgi:hypothetical protein
MPLTMALATRHADEVGEKLLAGRSVKSRLYVDAPNQRRLNSYRPVLLIVRRFRGEIDGTPK